MQCRPILSALMRSKVSMILIGSQVALTLAIVCNSLFIIVERAQLMNRPSGMNESDTFIVGSNGFAEGYSAHVQMQADLTELRALPGVADVTNSNSVPLSGHGWMNGIRLNTKQTTPLASATLYFVDAHGINSFGTHLIAGRNFTSEETQPMQQDGQLHPSVVIASEALAEKLFPNDNAIGKVIYLNEDPPATIVGIVDRLQGPFVNDENVENTLLIPGYMPYGKSHLLLVRADAGRRDEVMKGVEQSMIAANTGRIVGKIRSLESLRHDSYRSDRAMMTMLSVVIFCLLAITALGIGGMASFWVIQRTKHIGTRRALGATRGMILRYFLLENFLITTLGLIVGGVLAYGLSLWILATKDGARLLPWYYVLIGFVCLWMLGQIAVFGPARRAAHVPPAVATRGA